MARPAKIRQKLTRPDGTKVTYADAVVELVAGGAFVEDAAKAVGLAKDTIYTWLARGREHRPADDAKDAKIPQGQAAYVEFADAYTSARGQVMADVARSLAYHPDWRARAWYAERTDPKRFGKRVQIETDPEERTPEPVDHGTAQEVHEAFVAAHVPEGMVDDLLPALRGEEA